MGKMVTKMVNFPLFIPPFTKNLVQSGQISTKTCEIESGQCVFGIDLVDGGREDAIFEVVMALESCAPTIIIKFPNQSHIAHFLDHFGL